MTSIRKKADPLLPTPLADDYGLAVLDWLRELLPAYTSPAAARNWQEAPPFEWSRGCAIRIQLAAPAAMLHQLGTRPRVLKKLFAVGRRLLELSTAQHRASLRELAEQEGLQ